MKLQVVTPRSRQVDQEVDAVTLPGALGEMTLLPGHTALVSNLVVGVLKYVAGGKTVTLAINRGVVEVLDEQVTVLTETCESPSDIDPERAESARRRAEELLSRAATDGSIDTARAEYAMRRALARLKVVGRS
jgi:F-type H+-transporting ATPase subunit epsilon